MSTLAAMLLLGVLVGFLGTFAARVWQQRGAWPWGVVLVMVLGALVVWFLIMVLGVGPTLGAM